MLCYAMLCYAMLCCAVPCCRSSAYEEKSSRSIERLLRSVQLARSMPRFSKPRRPYARRYNRPLPSPCSKPGERKGRGDIAIRSSPRARPQLRSTLVHIGYSRKNWPRTSFKRGEMQTSSSLETASRTSRGNGMYSARERREPTRTLPARKQQYRSQPQQERSCHRSTPMHLPQHHHHQSPSPSQPQRPAPSPTPGTP